jgi:GNAT superfamily N-acetyltransferase
MRSVSDPGLVVRRATQDDATAIARAHVEAWRDAYAAILPAEELERLSEHSREEQWQTWLNDHRIAAWVVEHKSQVVGFASLGSTRCGQTETGILQTMYVLGSYRGRGLGRQLMRVVVDELQERGLRAAILWVLEANPGARRFYESTGWGADGATKDRFGGVKATAIRYRLRTPPLSATAGQKSERLRWS